MKEKIILTDADGCLVDWVNGFGDFMDTKGFPFISGTEKEYSMSIRHGISTQRMLEFIKEYNESEAIAKLDPFADSVEYVNKLANLGFRFTVITSVSDHPAAKINRTSNLTNLFGNVFDEIHCIELGASKASHLLQWADTNYFWIEDHQRQAEAGYEVGLKPILVDQPYNEHYSTSLFPRVSNKTPWKEIYEIITKEYKL